MPVLLRTQSMKTDLEPRNEDDLACSPSSFRSASTLAPTALLDAWRRHGLHSKTYTYMNTKGSLVCYIPIPNRKGIKHHYLTVNRCDQERQQPSLHPESAKKITSIFNPASKEADRHRPQQSRPKQSAEEARKAVHGGSVLSKAATNPENSAEKAEPSRLMQTSMKDVETDDQEMKRSVSVESFESVFSNVDHLDREAKEMMLGSDYALQFNLEI